MNVRRRREAGQPSINDTSDQVKASEESSPSEPDDRGGRKRAERGRMRTVSRVCLWTVCALLVVAVYLMSWPIVMYVARPPNITETVQLRRFNVTVAGLHPSLHGIRIAQLTDIHFNDNNSVEMGTSDDILRQAIELIEREDVDLVVLTGDYADHWPESLPALGSRWLSRLRSRYGTLAVLGNHEYQKPQSKRLALHAMALANVTVLINSKAEPINEWLEVIGIGDYWEDYHPDRVMYPLPPPVELEDRREGDARGDHMERAKYRKTRIVLTHNPDSAYDLNRWGADLMLAGHTHGGQSCLPPGLRELWPMVNLLPRHIRLRIPGALALRYWELSYGWYDVPRRNPESLPAHEARTIPLYTSSGLDRLPVRLFFCHPEVPVLTLLPAAAA